MNLITFFETSYGTEILAIADGKRWVKKAIYARPHCLKEM